MLPNRLYYLRNPLIQAIKRNDFSTANQLIVTTTDVIQLEHEHPGALLEEAISQWKQSTLTFGRDPIKIKQAREFVNLLVWQNVKVTAEAVERALLIPQIKTTENRTEDNSLVDKIKNLQSKTAGSIHNTPLADAIRPMSASSTTTATASTQSTTSAAREPIHSIGSRHQQPQTTTSGPQLRQIGPRPTTTQTEPQAQLRQIGPRHPSAAASGPSTAAAQLPAEVPATVSKTGSRRGVNTTQVPAPHTGTSSKAASTTSQAPLALNRAAVVIAQRAAAIEAIAGTSTAPATAQAAAPVGRVTALKEALEAAGLTVNPKK